MGDAVSVPGPVSGAGFAVASAPDVVAAVSVRSAGVTWSAGVPVVATGSDG